MVSCTKRAVTDALSGTSVRLPRSTWTMSDCARSYGAESVTLPDATAVAFCSSDVADETFVELFETAIEYDRGGSADGQRAV